MRPPSTPPGFRNSSYTVRIIKDVTKKIGVICPVCYRTFHINKWGRVQCPNCKSQLEYKEK